MTTRKTPSHMALRPWVVEWSGRYEDESDVLLVVARCESQAARLWRERICVSVDDAPAEALRIRLAEWRWPSVPPPPHPREPGVWSLEEKHERHEGLEWWRGYGFHEVDDPECDECNERLPSAVLVDGVCRWCVAWDAQQASAGGGA